MTVLILLLLFVGPAACCATLLPGLDPAARVIVSAVASIVIVAVVAEVMLAASLWSPVGGLAAVAVICGLLAGLSWARRR